MFMRVFLKIFKNFIFITKTGYSNNKTLKVPTLQCYVNMFVYFFLYAVYGILGILKEQVNLSINSSNIKQIMPKPIPKASNANAPSTCFHFNFV